MPNFSKGTFNIPVSGEGTLIGLCKYSPSSPSQDKLFCAESIDGAGNPSEIYVASMYNISISVANGMATVKVTCSERFSDTDFRCCFIPGNPSS